MKFFNRQIITWIFVPVIVLLAGSCGNTLYVRDITDTDIDTTKLFTPASDYLVQSGDILYVRLLTGNEEIDQMFNLMGNSNNNMSAGMAYYTGYIVSDSGEINLPLLRKVKVSGKNTSTIEREIEAVSKLYLKDAMAIVKLAGFKYTVLGEVRSPGVKELTTSRVNVFEAIASAGEITYYGKRDQVLVLRRQGEKIKQFRLDLTSPSIVNSPYYYIHPNDIIYVEPMKVASLRVRIGDFLTVLGAVTSIATAVFLLLSIK